METINEIQTTKIWKKTLKTLRLVGAMTDSSIVATIDRLAEAELHRLKVIERIVEMKNTTNASDVLAVANEIADDKIIVTAHIAGRTVRVNAIARGANDVLFARVSHRNWPEARHVDIPDSTEFQIYTPEQYAAMLDAVREKVAE